VEREPVVAATYSHSWDAELARNHLEAEGLAAWVETPAHFSGAFRVRLFVDADRLADARAMLAELEEDVEVDPAFELPTRRPLWITVATIVLLGGIYAAVIPEPLWWPTAGAGLAVLWLIRRHRRAGLSAPKWPDGS